MPIPLDNIDEAQDVNLNPGGVSLFVNASFMLLNVIQSFGNWVDCIIRCRFLRWIYPWWWSVRTFWRRRYSHGLTSTEVIDTVTIYLVPTVPYRNSRTFPNPHSLMDSWGYGLLEVMRGSVLMLEITFKVSIALVFLVSRLRILWFSPVALIFPTPLCLWQVITWDASLQFFFLFSILFEHLSYYYLPTQSTGKGWDSDK